MVINIDQIEHRYTPVSVLVIHQNDTQSYRADQNLPNIVVTRHSVYEDGSIGAGSPLTEEFVCAIGSHLLPLDIIHERVIAQSANIMIWWRPACVSRLTFAKSTGIASGKYPVPPLLFMLDGTMLFNWALRDNSRPVRETKLYRSPFFNIYDNGRCCMGDINIPDTANIEKWEDIFVGGRCTKELPPTFKNGNPRDVWNQLKGKAVFPVETLRGTGETVKSVIERQR